MENEQNYLKKASSKDIADLQRICVDTYSMYFSEYWNEHGLNWYLDKQFGNEKLNADLCDQSIDYYFIIDKEESVGFIKVNSKPSTDSPFDSGAELEKMYMLPSHKGLGIGEKMLNLISAIMQARGKEVLFLFVLDTNLKAIKFYNKLGFRFHSKTRLNFPFFKDELRGLDLMVKKLKCSA